MKHFWFNQKLIPALVLSILTLSACGPQAFVQNTVSSRQTAAGTMNIPPKVDIVLGVSMNGTMRNIFPGLQTDFVNFLKGLQNAGWDYRFVSIPLSEYQPTSNYNINNAVSVSNYDANYPVGTWLPPFPGASHSNPLLKILSSLFSPFFITPALDNDPAHNNAHETGLQNQVDFLTRTDVQANFLRSDALLAMVTLSNGNDRSGGTWPSDSAAQWQPGITTSSYASQLQAVKGSPLLLKYYSVVANPSTSCRGLGNWYGERYIQVANLLGNANIDICTTELKNALTQITGNLQTVKARFRKKYLVIASLPNVPTIRITKYTAGGAIDIPQDANNGWTYEGIYTAVQAQPQNNGHVFAIDDPIAMDEITSGYVIELHGAAKLMGDESADVTYQNAGSPISH